MNMNIIKIQEISEKTQVNTHNAISEGSLRRKQMMEQIRNGSIKQSVSLDVSLYKQIPNTTSNNVKTKRGRKSK